MNFKSNFINGGSWSLVIYPTSVLVTIFRLSWFVNIRIDKVEGHGWNGV